MYGMNWIVNGFGGGKREVPAGGYQTRPATTSEKVLVGVAMVLTVAAPVFGLITSLLR